jgi:hypothetical protein
MVSIEGKMEIVGRFETVERPTLIGLESVGHNMVF